MLLFYGIDLDYSRCGDIDLRVYAVDKSLYDIINEYADYAYMYRKCKCMVINDHKIVFYRRYSDLNNIDTSNSQATGLQLGVTDDSRDIEPATSGIQGADGNKYKITKSGSIEIDDYQYGAENKIEQNSSTVVAIRYENIIKYRRAKKTVKIECYGLPNVRKGKCFIIDYGKFEYEGYGLSKQKLTYMCTELNTKYDLSSNGWTQEITAICTEDPDKPIVEDVIITDELEPELKPTVSPEVAPDPQNKLGRYDPNYKYRDFWNKYVTQDTYELAKKGTYAVPGAPLYINALDYAVSLYNDEPPAWIRGLDNTINNAKNVYNKYKW